MAIELKCWHGLVSCSVCFESRLRGDGGHSAFWTVDTVASQYRRNDQGRWGNITKKGDKLDYSDAAKEVIAALPAREGAIIRDLLSDGLDARRDAIRLADKISELKEEIKETKEEAKEKLRYRLKVERYIATGLVLNAFMFGGGLGAFLFWRFSV